MTSKSWLSNVSIENCENGCMKSRNGTDVIPPEQDLSDSSDDGDTSCDDYDVDDYKGNVELDKAGNEGLMWLGFVKKPRKKSSFLPDKAGGTPAWLDPIHLPIGRSFLCDFCQDPLQFVLQVNAPIVGSESAYDRVVFVFMCPSMTCLRRDQHEQQKTLKEATSRSVKVFRCQQSQCENHHGNESTDHLQLGAPLCSWCGTWKGDQLCSGCRRVRYCSKKHQILHWRLHHKIDCKQSSNSCLRDNESSSAKKESVTSVACNTLWPEYEMRFKRHNSKAEFIECHESGNSLVSIQGMDEDMKPILEGFDDDDKKSLASFQKHMNKDPAQVLRCWTSDGKPLWPEFCGRPSVTDIPKCNYCDGRMRFEFQIMPQLLYYFGVENEVDSLDWATIAIYTCEASCDSAVTYKEEFPWVQLYSN